MCESILCVYFDLALQVLSGRADQGHQAQEADRESGEPAPEDEDDHHLLRAFDLEQAAAALH